EARRWIECMQPPALVRPGVLFVVVCAGRAISAAFTVPRLFLGHGRQERARAKIAFERPGVPLLDGWHPERVLRALVELFRRLWHERGRCYGLSSVGDGVAAVLLRASSRRELSHVRRGTAGRDE